MARLVKEKQSTKNAQRDSVALVLTKGIKDAMDTKTAFDCRQQKLVRSFLFALPPRSQRSEELTLGVGRAVGLLRRVAGLAIGLRWVAGLLGWVAGLLRRVAGRAVGRRGGLAIGWLAIGRGAVGRSAVGSGRCLLGVAGVSFNSFFGGHVCGGCCGGEVEVGERVGLAQSCWRRIERWE